MYNLILKSPRRIRLIYMLADILLVALSFYGAYIIRYNSLFELGKHLNLPNLEYYNFIFILWTIFILVFFSRNNLYYTNRIIGIPSEIFKVSISVLYSGILIGAVIFFAQYKFFSRQVFLVTLFLLCFLLSGWRAIKRVILRSMILKGFNNLNIMIIGGGQVGLDVYEQIKLNPWLGLKVVGFLDDLHQDKEDNLGCLDDFQKAAKQYFIDQVIITIPSEKGKVAKIISQAKNMNLGLSIVPEAFEENFPFMSIDYLGNIPLINYKERIRHPAEFALKRCFDLLIAIFMLILLIPVFIIIAILIKMDSRGPVFYIQKRVGSKGKIFNLYKFRSMVKNADCLKEGLRQLNEVQGGVIFKIRKDPRITRFGRFLRKYSLDELPQLINVVKADMSLVGPRPPTPDEVEKYHYDYMQRLAIKPGITGLSQIKGRSELTFRRWMRWDLWYINNWSFGLDLKIIFLTLPRVLKGKGAY